MSPKNHHHHPLSQSNQIVPRLEICPCVLKLALDRIIPLPYLLRAGYTKSRTFGIWRARLEHPDRCWGENEATHAHFSLSILFGRLIYSGRRRRGRPSFGLSHQSDLVSQPAMRPSNRTTRDIRLAFGERGDAAMGRVERGRARNGLI